MKESQGMFKESVVYVTTQGSQVRINGGQVVIYDVDGDDGELGSFPVEKLDTINVFGGVNFDAVRRDGERTRIVLNYFTQNGKYRGSFVPERNTIAEVRRAQYALDERDELAIAKAMIAAKVRNARTLLSRKGVRGTTVPQGSRRTRFDCVEQGRPSRDRGRGRRTLLQPARRDARRRLTFETRSKRPPKTTSTRCCR